MGTKVQSGLVCLLLFLGSGCVTVGSTDSQKVEYVHVNMVAQYLSFFYACLLEEGVSHHDIQSGMLSGEFSYLITTKPNAVMGWEFKYSSESKINEYEKPIRACQEIVNRNGCLLNEQCKSKINSYYRNYQTFKGRIFPFKDVKVVSGSGQEETVKIDIELEKDKSNDRKWVFWIDYRGPGLFYPMLDFNIVSTVPKSQIRETKLAIKEHYRWFGKDWP